MGWFFIVVLLGDVSAREWTDREGRNASGEFVRVFRGNVVLQRGKQVLQVPFANFSPEDQEYIRRELEKKNQGHLLEGVPTEPVTPDTPENPEGDPATDPAANGNGNPGVAAPMFPGINGGAVPPPIGPGAPAPIPPVINSPLFPGVGNPDPEPPSESADPAADPPPVTDHGPNWNHSPTSNPPWKNESTVPPPERSTFDRSGYMPASPPSPIPAHHPSMYAKMCSNCKKEVPRHLTAGDSCPNCGVTFETDMSNGKTALTAKRIAWMVSVAVGVLLAIGRMLNR